MKIAIDSSALVINRFSGLAQVIKNLIQNILLLDTSNQINLYVNYFKSKSSTKDLPFQGSVNHALRLPRRLVDFWWNLGWPAFESYLKGMDVFHSLHINIPPTKNLKTILTVHDCRYLAFPTLYKNNEVKKYRRQMETSLKRADMLVAVSDFTRREIVNFFSFPIDRIKVIYNGFAPIQSDIKKVEKKANIFIKKNKLPLLYLLYIGSSDPRKNLNRLIDAIYHCRKVFKDFPHLLIAGIHLQDWDKSGLKMKVEKLNLSNYIHLCGVIDNDLLFGLTKKAVALCYPSLYEGFGFPPLEAMSLGVPVLAGKCSSIPEVVGNSACLVNPSCLDDIIQGMSKIVFDSEYSQKLIKRGYKQVNKFSWINSAAEYISLYREVLDT
jgi:glycosyltransferase involved in cell wall biosynthesis